MFDFKSSKKAFFFLSCLCFFIFLGWSQVSYGCSFTHDDLSDEEDKAAPFEKKQAFQSWGAVFDDELGKVTLPIRADQLQSLEALLTNHEEILDFYDPYVTLESSPNSRMLQTFTKFKKLSGLKMVRGQELTIQEAETIGKIMKLFPSSLEEIDLRGTGMWSLSLKPGHHSMENGYTTYPYRPDFDMSPLLSWRNSLPFVESLKSQEALRVLRIHHLDFETGRSSDRSQKQDKVFGETVTSLKNLETLDFSYLKSHNYYGVYYPLQFIKGLKHLIWKSGSSSQSRMISLQDKDSLETLDVSFSFYQERDNYNNDFEYFLAGAPNLKSLFMNQKRSKDTFPYPFRNQKGILTGLFLEKPIASKKIEKLDLGYNIIKSESLRSLQFMKNLTYLDLSHNELDDWAISLFYHLPLIHLDLSYNTGITDISFKYSENLPQSLKLLKICGNNLKWSTLFDVIEKLETRETQPRVIGFEKKIRKSDPFLKFMRDGQPVPDRIDLVAGDEKFPYSCDEEIGDAGGRLLLEKIRSRKGLKALKLKGMSKDLMFELLDSVEDKSSLTDFYLSSSNQSQDHKKISHLTSWLKDTSVKELSLYGNVFYQFSIYLQSPSQISETLTHLNLTSIYNGTSNVEFLKNLKNLISLKGPICGEIFDEFFSIVKNHPNLESLDVSHSTAGPKLLNFLTVSESTGCHNLKKLNIYGPSDVWLTGPMLSSALINFLKFVNQKGSKLTHLDVGGTSRFVDKHSLGFNWKDFNAELAKNRSLKHLGLVDVVPRKDLEPQPNSRWNKWDGHSNDRDFTQAIYSSGLQSVDFSEISGSHCYPSSILSKALHNAQNYKYNRIVHTIYLFSDERYHSKTKIEKNKDLEIRYGSLIRSNTATPLNLICDPKDLKEAKNLFQNLDHVLSIK